MALEGEQQQGGQQDEQSQVSNNVQSAIDYIARQLAYSNLTEYSGTIVFKFHFQKGNLIDKDAKRELHDNPME